MRKLDMNKLAALSTAAELLDAKYGKEGTPERESFDAASKAWYEEQTETGSYRITMPKPLHASLSAYAQSKGMSISACVSQLVSKELRLSY